MRRAFVGWQTAGLAAAAAAVVAGVGLLACGKSAATGSAGAGGAGATTSGKTVAGTGGAATTGPTASTTQSTTTTTGTTTTSTGTGGTPFTGDSVLMHHKNPNRDGLYVEPALTRAAAAGLVKDPAFNATVVGAVYAQPLFVDGGANGKDRLFVVTEENNVYALDAATGAQVWTRKVGGSVPLRQTNPASALPCGNIDPYGITGTPAIDLGSRSIFFDALTSVDHGVTVHHELFALSIDTGAIQPGWPVDVGSKAKSGATAFNVPTQGQRGALAIVNGTLYVPYGGLYGDCPSYHGWVVAVAIADPTNVKAWATPAAAGGTWAPGGVSTDGTSLYICTGNTQGTNGTTWGGGDAVIRFGLGAAFSAPTGYFAPKNWFDLDNFDQDLGAAPVLFDLAGSTPKHLAITFGKDSNAYLLDPANLGGVSDALGTLQIASNEIITAPAVYTTATATYAVVRGNGSNCTSGSGDLTAITIVPGSPPTLAYSWCAAAGTGSPMVTTTDGHAEAIVWNLGADDDDFLHGINGDTGAVVFGGGGVSIPGMQHFNTPIAAKGRLFVAADGLVVAFKP